MGVIYSKFSGKKKSTLETLEDLEKKIHKIEEYRIHTEQRHKKIVGHLILYSVSLYVITALIFYFYFFPASLKDQFYCILPLLLFPVLVILVKKIVSWYYERKVLQNEEKINSMREEKKEILNMVMEKETYKIAKEILEKFAPEQLRTNTLPSPIIKPGTIGTELKRRNIGGQSRSQPGMPTQSLIPQRPAIGTGALGPNLTGRVNINGQEVSVANSPRLLRPANPSLPLPPSTSSSMPNQLIMARPGQPKLARPIIPSERGVLDRLVDFLMADGPTNRYALICKECHAHNGMALKEEFEYLAFHCCFCNSWNPSRKQRPHAPRLQPTLPVSNLVPESTSSQAIVSKQSDSTSTSELESPPDSESDSESSNKISTTKILELPAPTQTSQQEELMQVDESNNESATPESATRANVENTAQEN